MHHIPTSRTVAAVSAAVVLLGLAAPALAAPALAAEDRPTGRVFLPNPVVVLQDQTHRPDGRRLSDARSPRTRVVRLTQPRPQRVTCAATTRTSAGRSAAFKPRGRFLFDRSDDRFEQTMAYYAITKAQRYLQSLGFTDINEGPQVVKVRVRFRQQLLRPGEGRAALRQRRRGRRRGHGDHLARVRSRDPGRPGAGVRDERRCERDRRGVRRLLGVHDERAVSRRGTSLRASGTGTPSPTRRRFPTACAASTSTSPSRIATGARITTGRSGRGRCTTSTGARPGRCRQGHRDGALRLRRRCDVPRRRAGHRGCGAGAPRQGRRGQRDRRVRGPRDPLTAEQLHQRVAGRDRSRDREHRRQPSEPWDPPRRNRRREAPESDRQLDPVRERPSHDRSFPSPGFG